MNTSTLILAFISSIASIAYLIRGLYLYRTQWDSIMNEDSFERDRLIRIQIHQLFPDHVLYTLFLLAMAIAMHMYHWFFPILFGYFCAVKYTMGFGLLAIENKQTPFMRNLGLLLVLLPMIILSFYNLFKVFL